MWPLGGLLDSLSTELKVPGQDSPATFSAFAGWPNTAFAGVYINKTTGGLTVDGYLSRRNNDSYLPQTNMWIHADSRAFVDVNDYEFRFVNVTGDTAALQGSAWVGTSYGPEDGWISGHLDPFWYITASGPQFGQLTRSVSGLISVREKANTANIRVGNLTLQALYEGEN